MNAELKCKSLIKRNSEYYQTIKLKTLTIRKELQRKTVKIAERNTGILNKRMEKNSGTS